MTSLRLRGLLSLIILGITLTLLIFTMQSTFSPVLQVPTGEISLSILHLKFFLIWGHGIFPPVFPA